MTTNDIWARRYADFTPVKQPLAESLRAKSRHLALYWLGATASLKEKTFLRCVYCHQVYDDQIEDFRGHLRALQKIGRFLNSDELMAVIDGRHPLDGRYFHLSFDDGFDNIYLNAFPVMQELGIRSIVFIPTRFVNASDEEVLADWWTRDEISRPTKPLLWSWLKEMAAAGHDIGSHTRHHARLSAISGDADKLRDEIAGSKADIEAQIGGPCRYFSWPYGKMQHVDDTALRAVEAAGYEACFSAERGQIFPRHTSKFVIPRHHFEPQDPWLHVRYFALGGQER